MSKSKGARRAVNRKQQRGNAVLFALLGLVIGGAVLAKGIEYYQESERSAQVQATTGEVNTIIGKAKQNYGQYGYAGLTTAIAVGSQVIPRNLAVSATAANNAFSGAITLVDNSATTPGTALLTYANVPQETCTAIVNGTASLARQVQVAGVDVKALDGAVDVTALNTQCTSAGLVPIAWTIART